MGTIRVKLHELLNCLSGAQDLADPRLSNHHQQVAYLSYRFAEHLGLKNGEKNDIFSAALIHDVGALSKRNASSSSRMSPWTSTATASAAPNCLKTSSP